MADTSSMNKLVGAELFNQYVTTLPKKDAYTKNDVPKGDEEIDRLLYTEDNIKLLQQSALKN